MRQSTHQVCTKMAEDSPRGLCCSVCYNAFKTDDENLVPRVLKCGHTYCSACLQKIAAQCHNYVICCPTCKSDTPLFSCYESVSTLPKNFGLMEIVEAQGGHVKSIAAEKPKNRYTCPEHDEPMKVYCHTDNCLVCIYCQVYGAHKGHNCELASNLAQGALEELQGIAKNLERYHSQLVKARKKIEQRKQETLEREHEVKIRIGKHFRFLKGAVGRIETTMRATLETMTKDKVKELEKQEQTLTDIMRKCEQVHSHIQTAEANGDSAILQERCDIGDLMTGIAAVIGMCELKPRVKSDLMYNINHNLIYELEHAGEVIKDPEYAEVEEPDEDVTSSDHHLLTELRESLEQIATQEGGTQLSTILTEGCGQMHLETMSSFTVCTAPVPVLPNLRPSLSQADNYGPLSMTRGELQSVEIAAPLTTESDVAAKEDEEVAQAFDGGNIDEETPEDEREEEEEEEEEEEVVDGAIGGAESPSGTFETQSSSSQEGTGGFEDRREDLLRELQREIEKLKLFNIKGEPLRVVDNRQPPSSSEEETDESSDSSEDEHHALQLDFQIRVNNDFSRLRPSASSNSPQSSMSNIRRGPRLQCSVANCQYHGKASLQCRHCGRVFCCECAPNSTSCNKNDSGHWFVSYKAVNLRVDHKTAAARNFNPKNNQDCKKIRKCSTDCSTNNVPPPALAATCVPVAVPWHCKRCTMANRADALVCEACETSRDFDPREVRAVCPMCTLVNEPGKRKCELCETALKGQDAEQSQDSD